MKRETQDVNNVDYKGQKEGKLLFFKCLLHPGSFHIISLKTHVNPVSNGSILISTFPAEKIAVQRG